MNTMLDVLARVPRLQMFRQFGWPMTLPLNLTLSPSIRCNSRCLTCNLWKKQANELALDEWDRVLRSLARAPYWFTVSGGEPFLFTGIVEICQMAYAYCKPGIINIPTNSLTGNIAERVQRIAESCTDSQIIINLSLDGLEAHHDRIRGVPGNFAKFERTLSSLLELKESLPNLTLGIHSVISVFNIDQLEEIIEYAGRAHADQFITEIAEERVELGTIGMPITPSREAYSKIIDQLIARLKAQSHQGTARITQAFRIEYYRFVKEILEKKRQIIPCYAGVASAHIYSDGTVWPCCVRADPLGNVRDYDYDFSRIWSGATANEVRRSIAAKDCHCPLANAFYTNMLHDPITLAKVGTRLISSELKQK